MGEINKVIIIGKLAVEPELRYNTGGSAVCKLVIPTHRFTTDKTKEPVTDWHKIIVWDKQAENCAKYLQKGSQVYIEGEVQYSKWKDKEGVERYNTEIRARIVQFLDNKEDSEYKQLAKAIQPTSTAINIVKQSDAKYDDTVPF